jgi:hypothetical protein
VKVTKENLLERLSNLADDDGDEEGGGYDPNWSPSLSPTQVKIYNSTAKYILAHGNRGSGKTYVLGGHKLVRHAYENFNALCLIIVGIRSQAILGGVWHKVVTEVLPLWKEGIGIEYTEERQDTQKNIYIDVQNKFGGWSRIYLISIPHGTLVKNRVKGFEPSYLFVDELTNLDGPVYFEAIVQQLGRRPGIDGVQQYTAACNPDGPSHWVYKRWWETPLDEEGNYNKDYERHFLDVEENQANLPPGYYDRVVEATKTSPYEYKRMVLGEWVDVPAGEAIFKGFFHENVHIVGAGKEKIVPNSEFPIIVGYDLGQVNHGITFLQQIVGSDKAIWTAFDEISITNEKVPYEELCVRIMRKMAYWNRVMEWDFKYLHYSDNSAFNQYRPGGQAGSYDVLDIERISKSKAASFGLEAIRMKPAPKFQGSVEARVRLMINKLINNEFVMSRDLKSLKGMFFNLTSEKSKFGRYDPSLALKPKRSKYIHIFDALTYPMISLDVGPAYGSVSSVSEIFDIGGMN